MSAKPKLTRGEREMFRLALRSETGNPWPLIGMRQRAGGAKDRMFTTMRARGWFDAGNCITSLGREIAGSAGLPEPLVTRP